MKSLKKQSKNSIKKRQDKGHTFNFNMKIKNFGPITEGEIDLKPLTVLIGPNQSGKSYVAMLIYTIMKSKILDPDSPPVSFRLYGRKELKFRKIIDSIENKDNFLENKPLIDFFTTEYKQIMNKKIVDQMSWVFVDKPGDLIKYGLKTASIEITFNKYSEKIGISNSGVSIRKTSELDLKSKKTADLYNDNNFKFNIALNRAITSSFKQVYPTDKKMVNFTDERLNYLPYNLILDNILREKFFIHFIDSCFYLPAARSGILQGHNALSASITILAPHSGKQKVTIPSLSGIISDFIQKMVFLPHGEKGPLYELARKFENELIYGEIKFIEGKEKFSYPEIKYSFSNHEMSLHRASSTVSELAPIFLALKFFVKPNDLLIIEEPEAHLHPCNQRLLAKLIVHLIRQKVRVLITTHSDFLLQQISNYILMSELTDDERIKLSQDKMGYLNKDEISVHRIEYSESKGNLIKKVIINEKGIPQEEFVKIGNDLYRESVLIQKEIQKLSI